jgi:hypothetical protein
MSHEGEVSIKYIAALMTISRAEPVRRIDLTATLFSHEIPKKKILSREYVFHRSNI